MKIIRTGNKLKLKLSKSQWKMIGIFNQWTPSILKAIKDSNNQLLKFADSVDISDEEITQSVRNAILLNYEKSFILRNDQGEVVDESIAKEAIINAFLKVMPINEAFNYKIKAHISNKRPFKLGATLSVEGGKKYLMPTFNMLSEPEIKSEFTSSIPYTVDVPIVSKFMSYGPSSIRGINDVDALLSMVNAAGFIASKGILEIGTIGSRSTNWDTSYNFHIDGIRADTLKDLLTFFTDISNQDMRNILRSQQKETFDLTQAKEVYDLMIRIGLKELLFKTIKEIKDFESKKGLKFKHQQYGKIPDYKNNTLIKTIPLRAYANDILMYLIETASKNPKYVQMITENGMHNIEEAFDVAFTTGIEGQVMTNEQIDELIEMAS